MTSIDHQPATPFEERLWAAHQDGQTALCLSLLRDADLALPITAGAAAGTEAPAWATAADAERTWVLAFTSVAAMRLATGGVAAHCRIASPVELAAQLARPAVGPGGQSGAARLLPAGVGHAGQAGGAHAGPGPADRPRFRGPGGAEAALPWRRARPAHRRRAEDLRILPPRAGRLAHRDARGARRGPGAARHADLRRLAQHPALAPRRLGLYRTPYGGTDEERRAAVAGWVVEEPPFTGLGLAPNVDQVIREYKVYGVILPHGAEIWELTEAGTEHRRALYHGDLRRWLLIGART
ncbi:SseB family protein [Nonomuraea ferruginea]